MSSKIFSIASFVLCFSLMIIGFMGKLDSISGALGWFVSCTYILSSLLEERFEDRIVNEVLSNVKNEEEKNE